MIINLQDSRAFYKFVRYKSFGKLLNISPKNLMRLKKFIIEVWYTNKNSKAIETEYKINTT